MLRIVTVILTAILIGGCTGGMPVAAPANTVPPTAVGAGCADKYRPASRCRHASAHLHRCADRRSHAYFSAADRASSLADGCTSHTLP